GDGGDVRANVGGDAPALAVDEVPLAGLQPGSHFEPEFAKAFADRAGAVDRSCRAIECCEEAIARGVHLPATELPKLRPNGLVMFLQQFSPGTVAELGRPAVASACR